VYQSWEYINRSRTHECGNWDCGCAIPFLGKNKWDFRCSVGEIFIVVSIQGEGQIGGMGLFAREQKSKLIEIPHGHQVRIKTGKRGGHVSD
jgi:hypothetical protein